MKEGRESLRLSLGDQHGKTLVGPLSLSFAGLAQDTRRSESGAAWGTPETSTTSWTWIQQLGIGSRASTGQRPSLVSHLTDTSSLAKVRCFSVAECAVIYPLTESFRQRKRPQTTKVACSFLRRMPCLPQARGRHRPVPGRGGGAQRRQRARRPHLRLHHRRPVPQPEEGRPVLVRERWKSSVHSRCVEKHFNCAQNEFCDFVERNAQERRSDRCPSAYSSEMHQSLVAQKPYLLPSRSTERNQKNNAGQSLL